MNTSTAKDVAAMHTVQKKYKHRGRAAVAATSMRESISTRKIALAMTPGRNMGIAEAVAAMTTRVIAMISTPIVTIVTTMSMAMAVAEDTLTERFVPISSPLLQG